MCFSLIPYCIHIVAVLNLEDIFSLINVYSGAPKEGRVDTALQLPGTQQGISHGASSLLRPSLLSSDLGYGRDGCHQANAARRGPSSATPATHELQARHAFKVYLPSTPSM